MDLTNALNHLDNVKRSLRKIHRKLPLLKENSLMLDCLNHADNNLELLEKELEKELNKLLNQPE